MISRIVISAGLIALFALFLATPAAAQPRVFATQGCAEIAGSFSFSSTTMVINGQSSSSSLSIFNIAPQFGYFVTDGLELGINPGVSFVSVPGGITSYSGGGSSQTAVEYFISVAYNIPLKTGNAEQANAFPFIEGQFGPTSISGSGGSDGVSGLSWGLRGGVKIVPIEHLLISVGLSYHAITLDASGAANRSGYNIFAFGVGLGGYF